MSTHLNPLRTGLSRLRTCRVETPTMLGGWSAKDAAHFEALIAACALVAHADGWVTEEERISVSSRVRGLNATAVFGVDRCLVAFDAAINRFDLDPDAATERAEAAILKLASQPGPASLVVEAACRVAASDGGFDGAERSAILDICQVLNLDPAPFGLVAPDGRR